ncbi:universal stress protein [Caldimonas tepidiphila]|uniref:universal stress protein n=1 Tax=Caldimonas tepidiphila TaxID=2315841 RepID=UPI000E5AA608|nr:universal stress protein [Caldimonas tepidiphila]
MYKHLLVPIDGSPLSNATVDQAVSYARELQARLTFLHARPDYAATGDGALMHAMAPAAFSEAAAGNARALVAKAEAAARAAGVGFASVIRTSDRPHEAILEAAEACGCDLVFMASRGRRGLKGALLGSVTHKVLQRATVPVLVAAVESNLGVSDEQRALATIRDEHRSLAAVIHALQGVLEEAARSGRPPDTALLRAMLHYIEQFPERLHHPKEEAWLFRRLRERSAECDALIEGLERQHAEGSALFAELRVRLAALEGGEEGALAALSEAVEDFARSQWAHMKAEEQLVLPAASRHLQPGDWAEIAAAFGANGDPRFGTEADESFARLASRLLNLAATLSRSTATKE